MIIIDTSAWVEFLRDTGSDVCNTVDDLLASDLAICDAISMEVLAGARNEQHLAQLRGLLARATVVPIISEDCLIAAVAIRSRSPILHSDADYAALARHTLLTVHAGTAP